MSRLDPEAALEALTRSDLRRDTFFPKGSYTDEDLISHIAGHEIDSQRMALLVAASRLLRLMHGLLVGSETGEGFVQKFSNQWLSTRSWDSDPVLAEEFDELNSFYSEISFFCTKDEHRKEEPLLFGLNKLKERTEKVYERLKKKFAITVFNLAC
jgi:hypothetical protein